MRQTEKRRLLVIEIARTSNDPAMIPLTPTPTFGRTSLLTLPPETAGQGRVSDGNSARQKLSGRKCRIRWKERCARNNRRQVELEELIASFIHGVGKAIAEDNDESDMEFLGCLGND